MKQFAGIHAADAAIRTPSASAWGIARSSAIRTNIRALALGALILLGTLAAAGQTPPQRLSLAIVPFTNAKPDAATDWLGHAAAETLALKLETLPAISCVERALLQKKVGKKLEIGDNKAVASLGKSLSADRVVVASYEVAGEELKIDLRVIDSRAPEAVATVSHSGKLKDVVDTVAELASAVVASFDKQARLIDLKPEVYDAPAAERLTVSDAERKQMLVFARPTYEAFEQFGKGLSDPDPFKQIKFFTEALKKDSTFFIPRLYRGFTHLDEKHSEMALDDFDGAIKADKNWPEPHYRKGQVYESLGRMRLASIAYTNYVEQSKNQRSRRQDEVKAKLKKWHEAGLDKKDDAGPAKKP